MLGLPISTERKKQIAKTLIFKFLALKHGDRAIIDSTFRRLDVVNVLHPGTINIKEGRTVRSIYVLRAELGTQDYKEEDIILLPKYIKQNLILVLSCANKVRLAVKHKEKFFQWPYWQVQENAKLELRGATLEAVWDNFVSQIGNLGEGTGDLDAKLRVQQLTEKMSRLRIQITKANPKKKALLFAELKKLEKELVMLKNG